MNRKFAISSVVMFVIAMGLGFFVHGVLLYDRRDGHRAGMAQSVERYPAK